MFWYCLTTEQKDNCHIFVARRDGSCVGHWLGARDCQRRALKHHRWMLDDPIRIGAALSLECCSANVIEADASQMRHEIVARATNKTNDLNS